MIHERIRILLVDDHKVVRAGFKRLLETDPNLEVVGQADNANEAIDLFIHLKPDITVMDLSLPEMGGLDAIKNILNFNANARILVLTVHESEPFPTRALRLGAAGYLTKRCAPDELITAIKQVHHGKTYLEHDVANNLAMTQLDGKNDILKTLTQREFEIFTQLAEGKSVTETAANLNLSPKTIHAHRANILKKLKMRKTSELIHLAIREGVVQVI